MPLVQDLLDTYAPNYMYLFLDVPDSPGSVRLSAIKSRSLEISWSRPHDGNSPILNYIIEYSNLPGNVFLAQLTPLKYVIVSVLSSHCYFVLQTEGTKVIVNEEK